MSATAAQRAVGEAGRSQSNENRPRPASQRRDPWASIAVGLQLAEPGAVFATLFVCIKARGLAFDHRYLALGLIAALMTLMLFSRRRLYEADPNKALVGVLGAVLVAWSSVLLGLLVIASLTQTTALYSRLGLAAWGIGAGAALAICHGMAHKLWRRRLRAEQFRRHVVVAPFHGIGPRVVRELQKDPRWAAAVDGYFDRPGTPANLGNICRLGELRDLPSYLRGNAIDAVFICLEPESTEELRELVDRLQGEVAELCVVPNLPSIDLLHTQFGSLNGIPVLSLGHDRADIIGGFVKRVLDLALTIPALVATAPVFLAIGALVRWDSPGPVIFKQRRYGLNGEEIMVFKFRTMNTLDDGEHVAQAVRRDPRVTRVGAWLRRLSLDELPQLFNVLQGTMSLVGPRPHPVAHNEFYRDKLRGYMLRHRARPGITGLAQVSGSRGETETLEKMQRRLDYDLEYIRNWSVLLDLVILVRTVPSLVRNRNVY